MLKATRANQYLKYCLKLANLLKIVANLAKKTSSNFLPLILIIFLANPTNLKANNVSLLISSVIDQDIEAVNFFINSSPQLVNQKNIGGATPLHIASRIGNQEIVNLLVENKANINSQDNEGYTPLMRAIANQNNQITDFLINQNAKIHTKNNYQETALIVAVDANCFECVKLITASQNFSKATFKNKKSQIDSAFLIARSKNNQPIKEILNHNLEQILADKKINDEKKEQLKAKNREKFKFKKTPIKKPQYKIAKPKEVPQKIEKIIVDEKTIEPTKLKNPQYKITKPIPQKIEKTIVDKKAIEPKKPKNPKIIYLFAGESKKLDQENDIIQIKKPIDILHKKEEQLTSNPLINDLLNEDDLIELNQDQKTNSKKFLFDGAKTQKKPPTTNQNHQQEITIDLKENLENTENKKFLFYGAKTQKKPPTTNQNHQQEITIDLKENLENTENNKLKKSIFNTYKFKKPLDSNNLNDKKFLLKSGKQIVIPPSTKQSANTKFILKNRQSSNINLQEDIQEDIKIIDLEKNIKSQDKMIKKFNFSNDTTKKKLELKPVNQKNQMILRQQNEDQEFLNNLFLSTPSKK